MRNLLPLLVLAASSGCALVGGELVEEKIPALVDAMRQDAEVRTASTEKVGEVADSLKVVLDNLGLILGGLVLALGGTAFTISKTIRRKWLAWGRRRSRRKK